MNQLISPNQKRSVLAASILFGMLPFSAFAQTEAQQLREQMNLLMQRIEQLEKKEKQSPPAQPEQAELQNRINDVEAAVLVLQKPTPIESALDGVHFGASFVGIGQNVSSGGSAPGVNNGQLNYRGDLEVEVPLGSFAPTGLLAGGESKFYAQVRLGQGDGVQLASPTFTGSVNSVAFRLQSGQPDESTMLVAQAWYQLNTPVNRFSNGRLDNFELTVGKIDPFVFFDNNPIADDESTSFLNNVFVHNPLLDSGGDMGVDSYGFTPGVRAAYTFDSNNTNRWTLAVGLFGAGNGSTFQNSATDPFRILQLQYEGKSFLGEPAFFQAYTWNNPQSVGAINGVTEAHSGYGLSAYQEFTRSVAAFTRLGFSNKGELNFDRAVTAGLQLSGRLWGRNADHMGFAIGALNASSEYEAAGLGQGSEKNAEIYYALQANEKLAITPSVQHIRNPAGVGTNPNITVLGVRTTASF